MNPSIRILSVVFLSSCLLTFAGCCKKECDRTAKEESPKPQPTQPAAIAGAVQEQASQAAVVVQKAATTTAASATEACKSAKEQAGAVAGDAMKAAAGVCETAAEKTSEVVGEVKEAAAGACQAAAEKTAEVAGGVKEAAAGLTADAQKAVEGAAAAEPAAGVPEAAAAVEQAAQEQTGAAAAKACEAEAAKACPIMQAAEQLKAAFSGNEQAQSLTSGLLGSLTSNNYLDASTALTSLSGLNLSKDQLPAYSSLVQQVAPVLLEKVFNTTGENANPLVAKAVELIKTGDLGSISKQLTSISQLTDLSSLQSGVVNNLIKSYVPVLSGIDTKSLINAGAGLLQQSK